MQHEITDIKDRLIDHKKKIEFQEREIADCTKRASQLNKDYNEQRKRLQLIESDIEKLRLDRHNFYRTAKVKFLPSPLPPSILHLLVKRNLLTLSWKCWFNGCHFPR